VGHDPLLLHEQVGKKPNVQLRGPAVLRHANDLLKRFVAEQPERDCPLAGREVRE
jgi:hypothetical protein